MKIIIIIDTQRDFITGSLGTPEAQAMIPRLVDKINHSSDNTYFIFTSLNYLLRLISSSRSVSDVVITREFA